MVTTKKLGGKAFGAMLWLGLAVFFAACQPPGPKALLDGEELIREGEYERALKRLDKAARLLPGNAQVWNHIGLAQHGLGNYQEAVNAYNQALKLDRNLAAAHFNLGSLFLDVNQLPDAINRLRVFVAVKPENPEGWLKLGTALLRSGNPDDAESAFTRALQKAPKDPEIHNNLGLVHVQRKRPREAMQCFRDALQLNPNYAPAILNEAIVEQYHLGDKRAALATYQRYLNTKPTPANAPEIKAIVAGLQAELNPPPVQIAVRPPTNQPLQVAQTEPPRTEPTNPPPAQAVTAKPEVKTNQVAVATSTNVPPEKPAERKPEVAQAEPSPKPSETGAEQQLASNTKTAPATQPVEAAPEPEEETTRAEAEAEPEPEPEPVPIQVVEIEEAPVFRPAVAPVDSAPGTNAPAGSEPEQMARAATAEPERPLLIPRRSHTEEEEASLLQRVNPMRFFRRDREPEAETEPAPVEPIPIRRPVPEEPATPPVREAKPLPPNLPRYSYRSNLQLTPGNRAEAEKIFREGARAQQEKRYLAAIELYKRALAADPTHYDANYNLGLAAYRAGDLPQALAANEQAVRIDPRSLNARFNFALVLRQANYPLDAVSELKKLLEEAPDEVRAHFALANIYAQELDQPLFAEQHYQRVLQLQPNHPDAARIRLWLAYPE